MKAAKLRTQNGIWAILKKFGVIRAAGREPTYKWDLEYAATVGRSGGGGVEGEMDKKGVFGGLHRELHRREIRIT